MGLQLRMTHSLGQRLIEVEARRADQAIVVGRASNAEVQIPSANIAKRHCLLFVHEGRWVVQDAQSPTGTFLNGERLTEPAFVNSGDVIALGRGSNPPTLTVDPHSVGVSEEKEEIVPAARVPAAAQPSAQWSAPVPAAPMSGAGMPPPLLPPQPAPARGFMQEDDSDNIFGAPAASPPPAYGVPGYAAPGSVPGYGAPAAAPVDEWGTAAASSHAKPRRRVVKQQGLSGNAIAITMVVSLVILAIAIPLIVKMYNKSNEVQVVKPPTATAPPTQRKDSNKSIFEDNPNTPRKGPTGAADTSPPAVASTNDGARASEVKAVPKVKAAPAPAPIVKPASPEMEPVVDKRREDPEWDAVESARSSQSPVVAIWKFHDYMDRFPDNPNKKDIDKYINDALDIIWWQRINELFTDRDAAQAEIASKKADLAISQDAEFKKGLQAEIAKLTERRTSLDSTIHDTMKFTGQKAPNLYDASDLAIARKTRDEEYYEKTWKKQVLNAITSSHGDRLPWKAAR